MSNPDSIETFEPILIGGLPQWLFIRSQHANLPILLYLHGGPGSPLVPVVNHFNALLENHFTVVQWEQRGSGKSYQKTIDQRSMTLEQFISDLHEVIAYLKTRFSKEKVYLLGHSWGSALGLLYAHKYPGDCHAYIATGQAIHLHAAETISYTYTLQKAVQNKNMKAIRALKRIGTPPYSGKNDKAIFKKYTIQRKWLTEFGGQFYDKKNQHVGMKLLMAFKGYSLMDKLNCLKGLTFSQTTLGKTYLTLNLFDTVKKVDVPLYFLIGKMDYTTPFELVQTYYDGVQAPHKELIWFEHSAHSPMFEEPVAFNEVLIHHILTNTAQQ